MSLDFEVLREKKYRLLFRNGSLKEQVPPKKYSSMVLQNPGHASRRLEAGVLGHGILHTKLETIPSSSSRASVHPTQVAL